MKIALFLLCLVTLFFVACKSTNAVVSPPTSKAAALLQATVQAHGGELYDKAHYAFEFRDKSYIFKNNGDRYYYSVLSERGETTRTDELTNDNFTRTEGLKEIHLSEVDKKRFGASLNSVIYFATLPHKLLDPAVNLEHNGSASIKGQDYEVLGVTFDEEGGGADHDDEYYYWINTSTKLIEFLAYNYSVNGGGVRFRSAYNVRRVAGIVFQAYINYKAPTGTPLSELPGLYENASLTKLSVIETEKVKKLSN